MNSKTETDRSPAWSRILSDEDWQFVKRFLLTSGSLKDLAAEYGISYPTVRIRLDRLIEKIRAADETPGADAFRRLIQSLVIDGQVMASVAKEIIREHEKSNRKRNDND